MEEVRRLATGLRRNARDERVLFHYNGHGVPKPTGNVLSSNSLSALGFQVPIHQANVEAQIGQQHQMSCHRHLRSLQFIIL